MNSIEKLIIENFQSHRKTIIEFAPAGQLTIIVGKSRSGKTTAIRALRWLFYNDPRGVAVPSKAVTQNVNSDEKSGYCRVGASFIRVTGKMGSGHTVIRERTAATNRYKIVTPGKEKPEVFEGFGDGVPPEVQEITGVRPIRIGDTTVNLNLSEQLDGPFMGTKSMTSPARAKVLGKLAGTEEIDYAGKTLGTDLHRREQDKKRLKKETADFEEKLKAYDWLPEMKKKIEALEVLAEQIKSVQKRWSTLFAMAERVRQLNEKIIKEQAVLYRWRGIEQAEKCLDTARQKNNLIAEINSKDEELDRITKSILRAESVLIFWNNLPRAEALLPGIVADLNLRKSCESFSERLYAYKQAMQACREVIGKYAYLPFVEERTKLAKEAAEKTARLRRLGADYVYIHEVIRDSQKILDRLKHLKEAEILLHEGSAQEQRSEQMKSLSAKWSAMDAAVTGTQMAIEKLSGIKEAAEKVGNTTKTQDAKAKLLSLSNALNRANKNIEYWKDHAALAENNVAEIEKAYHDLLQDAGVCPLCGQEIKKSNFKEAV